MDTPLPWKNGTLEKATHTLKLVLIYTHEEISSHVHSGILASTRSLCTAAVFSSEGNGHGIFPGGRDSHLWRDAKLILWQASTFYISPARYCHLGVLAFMFLLVVWLMSYLFHCTLWVPNTCLFFYLLMLIHITNVCILSALILDNIILARTLFLSYRNKSKLSMLLFRLKLICSCVSSLKISMKFLRSSMVASP